MRDEAGTYIGVPDCGNYGGVSHFVTKVSCGGKCMASSAFISCVLRGLLDAEASCTMYACDKYDGKQGKKS